MKLRMNKVLLFIGLLISFNLAAQKPIVNEVRYVPQGAPSNPTKGQTYVSNVDNGFYYYDGSQWIDVSASGVGSTDDQTAAEVAYTNNSQSTVEQAIDSLFNVENVKIVDTFEELYALTPQTNDVAIVTAEGVGGTFVYDATQSAVNDGGIVKNGWVRQYSGAVNVKWFGAVGDGVTDDTAAINLAASLGVPLMLGGGENYLITDTVVFINDIDFNGSKITYNGTRDRSAVEFGVQSSTYASKEIKNIWVESSTLDWTDIDYVGVVLHNVIRSDIDIKKISDFATGLRLHSTSGGVAHNNIKIEFINNAKHGLDLLCDGSLSATNYINENTFFGGDFTNFSSTEVLGDAYGHVYRSINSGYTGHNNNIFLSPTFQVADATVSDERIPVLFDNAGNGNVYLYPRYESGRGFFAKLDAPINGTSIVVENNRFIMGLIAGSNVLDGILELNGARNNYYESDVKAKNYSGNKSITIPINANVKFNSLGRANLIGAAHIGTSGGDIIQNATGITQNSDRTIDVIGSRYIGTYLEVNGGETFVFTQKSGSDLCRLGVQVLDSEFRMIDHGASDWTATTAYSIGDQVKSDGNIYYCVTSGTSGSTTLTGTGSTISDGSAEWDYQSVDSPLVGQLSGDKTPWTSSYGGMFQMGSDAVYFPFRVTTDVKYIRLTATGSGDINSFSLQQLSGTPILMNPFSNDAYPVGSQFAQDLPFEATGNTTSANVQDAIEELQTDIDAVSSGSTNIYGVDGTLTGNRNVSMNGFDIGFTGGGEFGIGTASPNVTLEITDTAPAIRLLDTDGVGTPYSDIDAANGNIVISADVANETSGSSIIFRTDGTERGRISDSGFQGNASSMTINDTANNFTTDTVEGALAELASAGGSSNLTDVLSAGNSAAFLDINNLGNLDMAGSIAIQGWISHAPSDVEPTAIKGNVYFDDSESTLKQYNGTSWEALNGGGGTATGYHNFNELTDGSTLAYANQVTGSGYRVFNGYSGSGEIEVTVDNVRSSTVNENYLIQSNSETGTITLLEGTASFIGANKGTSNAIALTNFESITLTETSDGVFRVDGSFSWVNITPAGANLYDETSSANDSGDTGLGSWTTTNSAVLSQGTDTDFNDDTNLSVDPDGNQFGGAVLGVDATDVATWSSTATQLDPNDVYRITLEHKVGSVSDNQLYFVFRQGNGTVIFQDNLLPESESVADVSIEITIPSGGLTAGAQIEILPDISSPYTGTFDFSNFRIEKITDN